MTQSEVKKFSHEREYAMSIIINKLHSDACSIAFWLGDQRRTFLSGPEGEREIRKSKVVITTTISFTYTLIIL